MFNKNLFKSRLVAEGYTQEQFASMLNISATALNNKVNGKAGWNSKQISECIKVLKLTPHDVISIFFGESVE